MWTPPLRYTVGDATRPDTSDGRHAIITHIAVSKRWPQPEEAYFDWSEDPSPAIPFALGQVQFVEVEDGITVANMIGQKSVGSRSPVPPIRYAALGHCLNRVASRAVGGGAVHMPRMGAGLAGGNWQRIEDLIIERLCMLDIPVTVYDLPKRR